MWHLRSTALRQAAAAGIASVLACSVNFLIRCSVLCLSFSTGPHWALCAGITDGDRPRVCRRRQAGRGELPMWSQQCFQHCVRQPGFGMLCSGHLTQMGAPRSMPLSVQIALPFCTALPIFAASLCPPCLCSGCSREGCDGPAAWRSGGAGARHPLLLAPAVPVGWQPAAAGNTPQSPEQPTAVHCQAWHLSALGFALLLHRPAWLGAALRCIVAMPCPTQPAAARCRIAACTAGRGGTTWRPSGSLPPRPSMAPLRR